MSRVCELSGKAVQVGNKVSHSQRKTRRRFLPNLQMVTFHSDTLNSDFSLRVAARAIKTVEVKGGLDAYLLGAKKEKLSPTALKIRSQVQKKAESK